MMNRTKLSLAVFGLSGVLVAACGGDDETAPVGVVLDRQTAQLVLNNRTAQSVDVEVSARVVCAEVKRNELVDLYDLTLESLERRSMPIAKRELQLTRFGNEAFCEVQPRVFARLGTDTLTLPAGRITLDTSGQPVPFDEELLDAPECAESERCPEAR